MLLLSPHAPHSRCSFALGTKLPSEGPALVAVGKASGVVAAAVVELSPRDLGMSPLGDECNASPTAACPCPSLPDVIALPDADRQVSPVGVQLALPASSLAPIPEHPSELAEAVGAGLLSLAPALSSVLQHQRARRIYDPWVDLPPPVKAVLARPPPPPGPHVGKAQPSRTARSPGEWGRTYLPGWVPLDDGLGHTYWWDTVTNKTRWSFPDCPAGTVSQPSDAD
jgi:hypothetical protein